MKLAPTITTSPLGEPGFKYEQQIWGDLIHGTKEQLQRIGLAVGMAFPGGPGGPKRWLHTTDHRGFPVRIDGDRRCGDDIVSASISFPGRDEPEFHHITDFASGVKCSKQSWGDEYEGTAIALVNAGLVRFDQLPGQPGMRKTTVTILPDGTLPSGSKATSRDPGAKRIVRASKNTFNVTVFIDTAEWRRRHDEIQRKRWEWEDRMQNLPRPAPLIALPWDGRSTAKAQPERKYRAEGNVLHILPKAEGWAVR